VLEFGSYVQVHEEHDNGMSLWEYCQGGYYIYSLITGNRLIKYTWRKLPMPEEVIKKDTLEDDSGNINNIEDQESYKMNHMKDSIILCKSICQ
jgi:hypothetical protein